MSSKNQPPEQPVALNENKKAVNTNLKPAGESLSATEEALKASSTENQGVLNALTISPEQAAQMNPKTIKDLEKIRIALQFETQAISQELQDDQELMVKDVAMLWQAAVERSNSIRFALEKLSKDDGTGKPVKNNGLGRRVAQSAARVAGVAGSMVTASPAGLIGGSMIEQILLEDPTSSAFQRVTDADMVILAKEVENLQSRVIELYYHYQQGQERLKLAHEASQNLGKYYDAFEQKTPDPALETIVSSLYESAKQDESQAQQAYVRSRNELSFVVGPDAIKALDAAHKQEAEEASAGTTDDN
ncbi:MAG: hypothetical protein VKJ04_02785 [Vampirovibrionales bacterium]|nr:hypothetical protein [Vampirovibrionales bacterium]